MPPPERRDFDQQARENARDRVRDDGDLGWGGDGRVFMEGNTVQMGRGAEAPIRHSRSRRQGAPGLPPPATSTPSPFRAPSTWDTLTINNVLFLGLVEITGATGNALDVKHPKGRDGGSITDSGAVCSEFQIVFRFWDEMTWASWEQVFAAIDPQRRADKRNPLDVTHPLLSQRGITRIYVKRISFPKRESGEWKVTADVIQWMPSLTAPRTGGSVTRTPTGPDIGANRTAISGLEDAPANQPDDPAVTDVNP